MLFFIFIQILKEHSVRKQRVAGSALFAHRLYPSIIPVPGYLCLVPHLRSLDDRFSYPII